jgi:hypothetical protein
LRDVWHEAIVRTCGQGLVVNELDPTLRPVLPGPARWSRHVNGGTGAPARLARSGPAEHRLRRPTGHVSWFDYACAATTFTLLHTRPLRVVSSRWVPLRYLMRDGAALVSDGDREGGHLAFMWGEGDRPEGDDGHGGRAGSTVEPVALVTRTATAVRVFRQLLVGVYFGCKRGWCARWLRPSREPSASRGSSGRTPSLAQAHSHELLVAL